MHITHRGGMLAALILAAAMAGPMAAGAEEFRGGDLIIEKPWVRATAPGAKTGGGYVTIVNTGRQPDTLVGGSFTGAAGFQLHTMSMEAGVMKMRPLPSLEIPAGGVATLSPSGTHIMLTDLAHGLKKGDEVEGTLSFEHAGSVPVRFQVEPLGATQPGESGDHAGHAGSAMPGMDMN